MVVKDVLTKQDPEGSLSNCIIEIQLQHYLESYFLKHIVLLWQYNKTYYSLAFLNTEKALKLHASNYSELSNHLFN